MSAWQIFEHDEIHDEGGEIRCPAPGCRAASEITGHEYTMALQLKPGCRTLGETWVFECDQGHSWALEPMADNSSLIRVFVHG